MTKPYFASEPAIGSVRREDVEGLGYALWAYLYRAWPSPTGSFEDHPVRLGWHCIHVVKFQPHPNDEKRLGLVIETPWPRARDIMAETVDIGSIPGTPAAETVKDNDHAAS